MALDRVVLWKDARPTHEEIRMLLADFFSGAGEIQWVADRWFCMLPGLPSDPFKRLRDDVRTRGSQEGMDPQRWIEVIPQQDDNVDVCTRHADRYTNALAEEIAQLLAWGWKGEREPM